MGKEGKNKVCIPWSHLFLLLTKGELSWIRERRNVPYPPQHMNIY